MTILPLIVSLGHPWHGEAGSLYPLTVEGLDDPIGLRIGLAEAKAEVDRLNSHPAELAEILAAHLASL